MRVRSSIFLSKAKRLRRCGAYLSGIVATGLIFSAARTFSAEASGPHQSIERSGSILTTDGLTLHLKVDLGSVEIRSLPPGAPSAVQYSIHIETDARANQAQNLLDGYLLIAAASKTGAELVGALPKHNNQVQFWVQYVVSVPANYNVEISTGAGDIQTADIGGRVLLQTEGGNITTGRLNTRGNSSSSGDRAAAKLETQGGHIKVLDVSGDLDAYTAGGHVMVGNIAGNAKLRTGGGHIRAGHIKGTAQIETDGGNITVGEAGAFVMVRTGGGQIDFGEVHGSVHAQTAGGGIRVINVSGPMEVETSGGSIYMTKVTNTVHALTGDGTITAWISPESQGAHLALPGPSQLASGTGDIIVFLPKNMAATIDATVESGGIQRIEADPSFPLSTQLKPDGKAQAWGTLNGGGAILKLRTNTGKIRLRYLDADNPLRDSLLEEQRSRIARKLSEAGYEQVAVDNQPVRSATPNTAASAGDSKSDWQSWMNQVEIWITGGVHEDPDQFKKRLLNSAPPDYPQLARRTGVQGVVILQVRLRTDGTLAVEKVIEGQPTLVEAATTAIQRWRATPEEVGGKKVDVISTVTFNFELR
jgi:TonB family protein